MVWCMDAPCKFFVWRLCIVSHLARSGLTHKRRLQIFRGVGLQIFLCVDHASTVRRRQWSGVWMPPVNFSCGDYASSVTWLAVV